MNRRAFISSGVCFLPIVLSGCVDSDNENTNNDNNLETDTDDSDQTDDENTDDYVPLPPSDSYSIEVYLAVYEPEDVTILDAENDNLTDHTRLADALSLANDRYEEGMEDEFSEDDFLSRDTRLRSIDITSEQFGEIRDLLDRDRWYNSQTWFVTYKGTLFVVQTTAPPEN